MNRRKFIKATAYTGVALSAAAYLPGSWGMMQQQLNPQKPLAINMWDYTWLLRHYKGGGMEDWDKSLDELVERGYNALRIDCFPQFIAADEHGMITEKFFCSKKNWRPALWGNQFSIEITPRESLISFLTRCHERDIYIGLSSWFLDHSTGRVKSFKTVYDLARAWNETLRFIQDHGLLKNILYVDLLNEYPLWNGYCNTWLNRELDNYSSGGAVNVSGKNYDFLNKKGKRFNDEQITVYNSLITQLIQLLSKDWPDLNFLASQTNTLNVPWQDLDTTSFSLLDIHCWFVYNVDFSRYTNYFKDIHILSNDMNFKTCARKISEYWEANKQELVAWMENQIIERKERANAMGVPFGNTEGWGTVIWMDHPDLDWNFTKETGLICAELGRKHGYSFNCSSNFNHPHFGLWNDIQWHKEVTNIIKNV